MRLIEPLTEAQKHRHASLRTTNQRDDLRRLRGLGPAKTRGPFRDRQLYSEFCNRISANRKSQDASPKATYRLDRVIGFSVQTQHQRFRGSSYQFNDNDLISLLESDPHVIDFQLNPELQRLDFTTLPDVNTRALNQALKEYGFIEVRTQDRHAQLTIKMMIAVFDIGAPLRRSSCK